MMRQSFYIKEVSFLRFHLETPPQLWWRGGGCTSVGAAGIPAGESFIDWQVAEVPHNNQFFLWALCRGKSSLVFSLNHSRPVTPSTTTQYSSTAQQSKTNSIHACFHMEARLLPQSSSNKKNENTLSLGEKKHITLGFLFFLFSP